jgi:ParB family transcriptional regulator, chromosome partitioning protein
LLDDKRLEIVARNRGLRAKEGASAAKLLTAFLRKAEEGVIGKLIIEAVIQISVRTQPDGGKVLRAAAQVYKVDTDAIALQGQAGVRCDGQGERREEAQSAGKLERKRFA